MNISLIPITQEDVEDLVTLRIAAMRESLERMGRFSPERARARFLESFMLEHTRHIIFDGQRVGFVMISPFEEGLQLDHLYIHPKFQNRRLGSQVLNVLFTEADALNLSIRVGALKQSDSNRFYLAHGFKLVEEGEWDNFYVRASRS